MSAKKIETLFREYLHTYQAGLNSISDVMTNAYIKGRGESHEARLLNGLDKCVSLNEEFVDELKFKKNGDHNRSRRNLLNSWYNECALRHPSTDSEEDKMKFAIWKIVEFYYTIFTGLSSLGRLVSKKRWGHKNAIDIFVDELLCAPELNNSFFVPPFCFVLDGDEMQPKFKDAITWEYGLSFHCPQIKNSLKMIKRQRPISIFHFFQKLREWASYQEPYIFINLYGKGPKGDLERYMNTISFCFAYLVERLHIEFYGYEEINKLYEDFSWRVRTHLNIYPAHLIARFESYENLA